jgi:biotin transport system substrate-specific component
MQGFLAGAEGAVYRIRQTRAGDFYEMSAIAVSRPLADRFVPEEGAARAAALVALAVFGSLILWASAKISVPFWPVPMTLQTGAVALIGAVYGARLGFATVVLYLMEGAAGMPVFQNGGGIGYLMGPTGGYLFAMAIEAAFIGFMVERGFGRNVFKLFGVMLAGDAIVFAIGLLWLGSLIGWDKPVLELGLYPFVLGDLVKLALAASMVVAGVRLVRR